MSLKLFLFSGAVARILIKDAIVQTAVRKAAIEGLFALVDVVCIAQYIFFLQ